MNPPPPHKKKGNERWGSERSCPQLHVSKTINMWNSSSDTLCLSWNLYFLNVLYRIKRSYIIFTMRNTCVLHVKTVLFRGLVSDEFCILITA